MTAIHVRHALLDDGWRRDVRIALDGRRIASIDHDVPARAGDECFSGFAVPGLANVHSHAFQRAMSGLTERRGPDSDNFWTWRELMYRFLARMTPDDVEAVAAWLYVEMLEAGFTAVGEFHYLHNAPDGRRYDDPAEMAARIAAAAAESGIGLTLLPSFYAHGGCGGAAPVAGQVRFLSDLDGFARLMEGSRRHVAALDGADIGIAPHSLRAVDAPELAALLAQNPSGPVHIHAAEQTAEVEACVAWSGLRPVEWLLRNGPVDRRWCLIHCTHMTPAEVSGLAAAGAVAGLCPITEANLGDGVFAAEPYREAGGRFGIGSDSNVRISLAEELRTVEYAQRLTSRRRAILAPPGGSTGRALFDAACAGGAQALARPSGALRAGADADIVLLDGGHPALAGRDGDDVLDTWIFGGGNGLVGDVYAGGRRVVSAGRHVVHEAAAARFAATMARLMEAA